MSSKGDIFDQLAPKGDIFDTLAAQKPPEGMEHGLASFYHQYPKEAISGNLISNLVKPFENWGTLPIPGQRSTTSEFLERQTGIDKLPPEAQQEAQIANFVAGLIPLIFGKLPTKTGEPIPNISSGVGKSPSINPLQQSYLEREAVSKASEQGGFGPELQQLVQKASPSNQAKELSGQLVSPEYTSPYEVAEQALKEAAPETVKQVSETSGKTIPFPTANELPDLNTLRNRVSTPQKVAAAEISPEEFKTDNSAAVELRNVAQAIKTPIQQQFNQEFTNLRGKTANISGPQEDLTKDLQDFLSEAEGSLTEKNASAAEKKVISTAQELLDKTASHTPDGDFIGFNDISVANLLKTKTSLGNIADFEMAESGFKSAFKALYGKVDKAIETMLRNRAPKEFAEFQRLNKRYSGFKNTFENENLRGLFQPKNLDYAGTFKGLLNPDSIASAERVLAHTEQGRKTLNKLKRDYFLQQTAGKTALSSRDIENLKTVLGDRFNKTIEEFQKQNIGTKTYPARKELQTTKRKPIKSRLSEIAEKVATHAKIKPEEILAKIKTRSGIKEIRKSFPNAAEKMIKIEARELLHEGKIKHNFSGHQIADFLNQTKNKEIFTEIFGEQELKDFIEAAEELKSQTVNLDRFRSIGLTGAKLAGATKILKIISSII